MKVVQVQWVDSVHIQGWRQIDTDFKDFCRESCDINQTFGLLAYECKEFVVVLQSVGDTAIDAAMKIPRSAIKSITELKKVKVKLRGFPLK